MLARLLEYGVYPREAETYTRTQIAMVFLHPRDKDGNLRPPPGAERPQAKPEARYFAWMRERGHYEDWELEPLYQAELARQTALQAEAKATAERLSKRDRKRKPRP